MTEEKPENTNENIDDLDLDEDFDLDDFDDETLGDEAWDDFDDEDDIEAETPEAKTPAPSPTQSKNPKQKTFLQKYFNVIVIGVAVLGGGGFVLMKLSAPPAALQNIQVGAPAPEAQGLPVLNAAPQPDLPMPTPIEALSRTEAPEMVEVEDLPLAHETLTPMPPFENLTDNNEPDPLSAKIKNIAAAQKNNGAQPETASSAMEETPAFTFDIETEIDDSASIEALMENKAPKAETFETNTFEELISNPITETAVETAQAVKKTMMKMPAQITGASAEEIDTKIKTAIADLNLPDLDYELTRIEDQLSDKIAKTNSKLDELSRILSSLESKLGDISTSKPEAPPAPKKAAPVKQEAAVKKAPVVKRAAPQWALRSAQPGQAVLKDARSHDIITIKTGDSVSGLGRINSIAVVNGKWVVSGTNGKVSQ